MSTALQPVINLGNWLWGILATVVAWVFGQELAPGVLHAIRILLLIVCIVAPLMVAVAYLTLWERKLIGWMQIRIGPNRVTFFGIPWLGGLAQPIADGSRRDGVWQITFAASRRLASADTAHTLLEIAESEGVAIASSCRSGVCLTCRTRLVEGDADCRSSVLDPDDRATGFILPCVTWATSDCVLEA